MKLEVLQKEMVAAMKARDKERKETISALVAAVKKLAIDEGKREDIPEELVDRAVLKELKTVKEQMDTCPDDRVELKEEYQNRYRIISEFAPKMMSEDEIKEVLTTKFAEVVATKNKGQIMKAVMAELKGKADGKTINQVVADLCK
ncbi:MAG: GatB/YqeY domain-containing protein [Lachnospiraceae bacterium]|nr:GatB/YqeY domain-containing protein [Lachnospiraceae bacterium]